MPDRSKGEIAMILGFAALAFFVAAVFSGAISYYFKKKRESEEEQYSAAPGPAASAPGPAAPSDVTDARTTLLQGAKAILVNETDINVASPPSIPQPFTINTAGEADKVIKYTVSFDIKVEKNLPGRDQIWTILDRGGVAEDATGRRPRIALKTLFRNDPWCIGPAHVNTAGCVKEDHYVFDKANTIQFDHRPSVSVNAGVGPQAGDGYKNCTIVVRSSGSLNAAGAIYWDGTKVADIDSNSADWGTLDAPWRWAGGQTAPDASIGYVKIKNAYIFPRDLSSDEVATLIGRGASATSTFVTEPWIFNPDGYDSD